MEEYLFRTIIPYYNIYIILDRGKLEDCTQKSSAQSSLSPHDVCMHNAHISTPPCAYHTFVRGWCIGEGTKKKCLALRIVNITLHNFRSRLDTTISRGETTGLCLRLEYTNKAMCLVLLLLLRNIRSFDVSRCFSTRWEWACYA